MQESFYFYDLETSGLNPRSDRIMQFAGMRTDKDFQPIGEPDNILVQLTDDTLPSPGAIMVTGITPNSTRADGISEREFCQYFMEKVATPGTVIMGYNSIRFDDEFIRAVMWRNFYDPYAWAWQDGRSRWDLLDVVRMTRALRPAGIEWPLTDDGKPTNRLELITKCNGISHEHAHDALSDVEALVSVTRLLHEHQPQMFDFLFSLRNKNSVAEQVNLRDPRPFVYASGRYSGKFMHTTVAYPIADAPSGSVLVFDLRYNLDELLSQETAARKAGTFDPKKPFYAREIWERGYFPVVKKLQYNHCPAVAPLGVLSKEDGWKKIGLSEDIMQKNLQSLLDHPEFVERMAKAVKPESYKSVDPESALYDGFLGDHDTELCRVVRAGDARSLADFHPDFEDARLPELLLHYKAKNFPETLDPEETERWEQYRIERLNAQAPKFLKELASVQKDLSAGKSFGDKSAADCEFLLEELNLWYQSLQ